MNEAKTNEANTNPKDHADEKPRSELPFFAVAGIFEGITGQGLARATENIEKMTNALREAYSANAQGTAYYNAKVIEFSAANTRSAFDFLGQVAGAKSPSEILLLTITQGRKNFEVTTAQNRELWELARKVATDTAEPVKKRFAGALPKAA
ncbi:phasin family protein [Bradyrhizobium sp. WSM 1738]|uniref:phasin family protein n=1 Tax=Bradyrhizobium hereditatis TaxID=2821405 RepID=UPI001CE233BE|nr:phasin family protein [Bradyrhizobium hereditatis]MCA6113327.1 phasin family protein [Bradyrhizobium hereditatis]